MSTADRVDLPDEAIFEIGEIIPAPQGLGPVWLEIITDNVINADSQDSGPCPEFSCAKPLSDEFMKLC